MEASLALRELNWQHAVSPGASVARIAENMRALIDRRRACRDAVLPQSQRHSIQSEPRPQSEHGVPSAYYI